MSVCACAACSGAQIARASSINLHATDHDRSATRLNMAFIPILPKAANNEYNGKISTPYTVGRRKGILMGRLDLRLSRVNPVLSAAAMLLVVGAGFCAPQKAAKATVQTRNPEDLLIVDCLLPGQMHKLGRSATFMGARRPVRTTQAD